MKILSCGKGGASDSIAAELAKGPCAAVQPRLFCPFS